MWVTFFLKYRKDIFYVLAVITIVVSFAIYRQHLIHIGEARVIQADEKARVEQQQKDKKVLKDAQDAHTRELQALKTDIAANPLPPVSLCLTPDNLPAQKLPRGGNSGSGAVASVHGGDSAVRPEAGPDIGHLLDLFAIRAEELSAAARELNTVTHP